MASFCFVLNPKHLPAASIIDTSMLILWFLRFVTFFYLIGVQRTVCQEQVDGCVQTLPAIVLGLACETRLISVVLFDKSNHEH